ncbi:MAG TPA: hypothetical protein VGO93_09825 [Candidatus Xenobia bacterium]|jgi:hypothetical protein
MSKHHHDRGTGLVLEDGHGQRYLIRREVLEHAQMPAAESKQVHDSLKAGHKTIGQDSVLSKDSGFTVIGAVNPDDLKGLEKHAIKDLPGGHDVSRKEAGAVVGGAAVRSIPTGVTGDRVGGAQTSQGSVVQNLPNVGAEGTVMCPSW